MAIITGLSLKKIENIFKICSLIRLTETEISKKYEEKKMRCPVHLSIGQEGPSSALSVILNRKDYAVSTHRSHAHFLAKGGDLKKMIAEIYGKASGCSGGKGGSMHLVDKKVGFMGSTAIVANSIPAGVGLGFSLKINKKKNVSVIFLGDAAVEQGVFFESVNFAVTKKLPVLFVCENNLYSVYSRLKERQPKNRQIYKMVKALGIKSYKFNSPNPLNYINKLETIVKKIKKSNEPCFIEFSTYRHLEHCGPNNDDNLKYRPTKEVNFWKKMDPYIKIKNSLKKLNYERKIEKIENDIIYKIKKAFLFAEKSNFPKKKQMDLNVFKKK